MPHTNQNYPMYLPKIILVIKDLHALMESAFKKLKIQINIYTLRDFSKMARKYN